MDDLRDLAAAYVVDALDDVARAAFERTMASDPDLSAHVADLREASATLADSVTTEPPARLKNAVLSAVADVEQERPAGLVFTKSTRWMGAAAVVLAVAAVILVLVAVAGTTSVEDRIDDVLATSDRVDLTLEGDAFSAIFTYSLDLQRGVFDSGSIPPISQGQTYQLWLIDAPGAVSVGIFSPTGDGSSRVLVEGDLAAGTTLGITIEPEGGSQQPTGDVLATAVIS